MANHLTVDELAAHHGLDRDAVLQHCIQAGVPIMGGRVDKSLFAASYAAAPAQAAMPEATPPRLL